MNDYRDKVFCDRYALKSRPSPGDLDFGDTVYCNGQLCKVISEEDESVTLETPEGNMFKSEIANVQVLMETNYTETIRRVAKGAAACETEQHEYWKDQFEWLLTDYKFVPGGRILATVGSDQGMTPFNCFVIPSPKDSRDGIFDSVKKMGNVMARGGGVGLNLSSLRPKGARVYGVNGVSSGTVSWGNVYSEAAKQITQGGSRRGALLICIDDWHPDLIDFVESKTDFSILTCANISVRLSNKFMHAVELYEDWHLEFPDTTDSMYESEWDGDLEAWKELGGKVIRYKTMPAKEIWDTIVASIHRSGEPGFLFKDKQDEMSNSYYYNRLVSTNPCGEIVLPPNGACNLGSINLPSVLRGGQIDRNLLQKIVKIAVRFLDNVIDVADYSGLPEVEKQIKSERRLGIGTMGLAELLIRLRIKYGSDESLDFIREIYSFIAMTAYQESCAIASEKGAFPEFEFAQYIKSGFIERLIRKTTAIDFNRLLKEHGIRNCTLLTQAPTATTSIMVGTSTGIEPYFSFKTNRVSSLGVIKEVVPPYEEWVKTNPGKPIPDYFVTADIPVEDHISVMAAAQYEIDQSIAKTINMSSSSTLEDVSKAFYMLWSTGCKGGTIYRDGSRDSQVLHREEDLAKRPKALRGVTYRQNTPMGTMYVTINSDGNGNPFEVFISVSKTGTSSQAHAEALGRLISLIFRMKSDMSQEEKVESIFYQLRGIGGIGSSWSEVYSVPDGIARVLKRHFELSDSDMLGLPETDEPIDICPKCNEATLLYVEGCSSCQCGWSMC